MLDGKIVPFPVKFACTFLCKLFFSEVLKTGRKGIDLGITAVVKNLTVQTFSVHFCKVLSASLNVVI